MKKIVAMLCALCMLMATPAMAAEAARVHPVLKTADAGVSNVMVTRSTVSRVHPVTDESEAVDESLAGEMETRATKVPTTYAPASWYRVVCVVSSSCVSYTKID